MSRNVFRCAMLTTVLQEVEFKSTFRNALQQLVAPLHSVSPLQQLSSQFLSHVLYKRMREFIILLWNDLCRRCCQLTSALWEWLHSVTGFIFFSCNLFCNSTLTFCPRITPLTSRGVECDSTVHSCGEWVTSFKQKESIKKPKLTFF